MGFWDKLGKWFNEPYAEAASQIMQGDAPATITKSLDLDNLDIMMKQREWELQQMVQQQVQQQVQHQREYDIRLQNERIVREHYKFMDWLRLAYPEVIDAHKAMLDMTRAADGMPGHFYEPPAPMVEGGLAQTQTAQVTAANAVQSPYNAMGSLGGMLGNGPLSNPFANP